jgi:pectinesterase
MNPEGLARARVCVGLFSLLTATEIGACKSNATQAAADAAQVDQQSGDGQSFADTGGSDTAAPGTDSGVVADATGDGAIACAPVPTATVPAGPAPAQMAGPAVTSTATRPELAQQVADGQFTIPKALAHGGTITPAATPAEPPTFALNDNWDPLSNGIGDPATFTPMFTVAGDGSGSHKTIASAISEAIFLTTCSRVYIRLMPGTYREQISVPSKTSAPPLTLYSTESDASKTVIVFDAAAATVGNMSASATLTVKALTGFQIKNLTVANDYVEGSAPGNDQSAVALLNQTDKAQFENVRVLGNIATLYLKSLDVNTAARSYFRDCYVEGDQDFILGRGTAVFDHTEIKVLAGRQPIGGVIAYPSTLLNNPYGFLFDSCTFSAEAGTSGAFLGHQWNESANVAAVGKMIVRTSNLGGHIAAEPWSALGARTTTPKNPAGTVPVLAYTSDDYYPTGTGPVPAQPFLAEYGNTGAGAHH